MAKLTKTLKAKILHLEKQLATRTEENTKLNNELEKSKNSEAPQNSDELKILLGAKQSLTESLETTKKKLRDLISEKSQQENTINDLQEKLKDNKKMLDSKKENEIELTRRITELSVERDAVQKNFNENQEKLQEAKILIDQKEEELLESKKTLEKTELENQNLLNEVEQQSICQKESEMQILALKSNIADLSSADVSVELKAQIDDLRTNMIEKTTLIENLKLEKVQVSDSIATLESENANLVKNLEEKDNYSEKLAETYSSLVTEKAEVDECLRSEKTKFNEMSKNFDILTAENDSIRAKIKMISSEKTVLAKKLEEVQNFQSCEQADFAEMKIKIIELESRNQEIQECSDRFEAKFMYSREEIRVKTEENLRTISTLEEKLVDLQAAHERDLKVQLTENQKMLEEKFDDIKEAEDNHEKDLVEMEKINQEVVTSLQEKIKLLEKNLQNFTDVEQELVINACLCGMI